MTTVTNGEACPLSLLRVDEKAVSIRRQEKKEKGKTRRTGEEGG